MTPDQAPSPAKMLTRFSGTLLLVGAGKMGGALLQGWLGLGLNPGRVVVIEPNPSSEVEALQERGLRLNPPTPAPADTLVLAIKPQDAAASMGALRPWAGPDTLVLSIMAGRTLGFLTAQLGAAAVRAMPNTPAAIGRGITVAVPSVRVSAAQRELAGALLGAVGLVEWLDDEALLDAVTAVSGSGPAYVFLMAECLAQAGARAGLPIDLAERLARATVSGAGELLHRSSLGPAALRENVTSPGGTTAAALEVLTGAEGIKDLMSRAVQAATERSRELAR